MALEGTDIILAALSAGAGAGVSDIAKKTVTGTWGSVWDKVKSVFERNNDDPAVMSLELFRHHPDELLSVIRGYVEAHSLQDDDALVREAREVVQKLGNHATGDGSIAANSVSVSADRGSVAGGIIGEVRVSSLNPGAAATRNANPE